MTRTIAAVATLSLLLAACGNDDGDTSMASEGNGEQTETLQVVASFYPVAEAAQAVGGDLVEVANLTPAGTEPHDLELRSRQVDQLQDADLVFYLGQGFQPAVQEIAERRDGPSVDLLDTLPLEEGAIEFDDHGGEDEHAGEEEGAHAGEEEGAHAGEEEGAHAGEEEGAHAGEEEGGHAGEALDPHFWLDPTLMADAVDQIEAALVEIAPQHEDAFAANAEAYRSQLADLDEEFSAALAECEQRVIVTSHAAFHYLAQRYDLEQLPIAGLSPEAEPGPQRIAELADLILAEGVTTVFYETLVAPDVAETLARETGAETAVLNPLEGLTAEDVEAGRDYTDVMRDNLAALTEALDCA